MKKSILYTIGTIIIISVIALIIGILSSTQKTEPEFKNPVNLNGTWKIYEYAGNIVENEYMTFTAGTVTYLKDNNERKSSYEMLPNDKLKIDEFNKEFLIKVTSDNHILLAESKELAYKLFKVESTTPDFSKEDLYGKWTVKMHANSPANNEEIEFSENGTFTDYRNNSVYVAGTFEWKNDNTIFVEKLGTTFEIYEVKENEIILLEIENKYVWELTKE